ncbi:MAG: 50S ribosomal protein L5 [Candidatus Bilamarchaeaceae archaeon]
MADSNSMRDILIDKVTVNIGVGSPGDALDNAKQLLRRLTGGREPVETKARRREPAFKLRRGLPIGAKVTLRRKDAYDFVEKALAAKKKVLSKKCFDRTGNLSFGIAEYIDFPGAKYDPALGMFGFDICITLKRKGWRVAHRKLKTSKIGRSHRISKEEAMEFMTSKFGVKIE